MFELFRRVLRITQIAVIPFISVIIAMVSSGPVASAAAMTATPPAYPGAQSCLQPHCYERAMDVHSNLIGAETEIQSSWFSMIDQTQSPYTMPVFAYCGADVCPWRITREMWLGETDHWIEIGLMNGYEPAQWQLPGGAHGCGCQAYFQFWEDGNNANGYLHVIANVSPDNSWHTYGISRESGSTFDLTVDGRVVGVSTASGASTFGESSIGSETNAYTTMQPLSYMNMSCQSWSVEDSSHRWFGVSNPNETVHGPGSKPPSQTYFGGWNNATHQLCIGKGGL